MKKIYLLGFVLIMLMASIFVSTQRAHATLPPLQCTSPCPWPITPAGLPGDVYDYLVNADTNRDANGNLATPSYSNWISPQNNTNIMQVLIVSAGTKSVPLSFNTAAVVGWIKSGTYTTGYNEVIPSNATAKPITSTNIINVSTDITPGNTTGLLYAKQTGYFASSKVNFNFSTDNATGFVSDYYEINIPYKGVNNFSNGVWQCVTGGQTVFANKDNWKSVCPTENRKFIVAVVLEGSNSDKSEGALTCTTADANVPDKKNNYFTGYAVDSSSQASSPTIALFEKTLDANNNETYVFRQQITANTYNPKTYNNLKSQLPGMVDGTKYDFKVALDDIFHDGQQHTVKAILITKVKPDFTLKDNLFNPNPFSFGGAYGYSLIANCGGGTVDQWMYPWLQTKGGDVIANGQIIGQNIQNPPSVIYSGSRVESSSDKEAEYLVISAVGGGSPFCSNNRYILTNVVSQLTDIPTSWYCNNGAGYSVLNNYDLNSGGGGDTVVSGANKAFSQIKDPACVTDNKNKNSFNNIPVPDTCNNTSAMYKLSGNDLDGVSVNKGKVTIIVNGDLNINQNIIYSPASGIKTPKDMPGLGIIVSGNIYIAPTVTRVDAILYAAGKIDTCGNNISPQDCFTTSLPADKTICGLNSSPDTDGKCFLPLTVNGAMIGKRGFRFGRSFWNISNSPAELIKATPELWLYPPLGMDLKTFSGASNTFSTDYSEFQPRVSE